MKYSNTMKSLKKYKEVDEEQFSDIKYPKMGNSDLSLCVSLWK